MSELSLENRGGIRGNASRYTSTVYNVPGHHLSPLFLRKGLVDPIRLMPMLFGNLAKMHGSRSEIRHTTVGVTGSHGVSESDQNGQWRSSKERPWEGENLTRTA